MYCAKQPGGDSEMLSLSRRDGCGKEGKKAGPLPVQIDLIGDKRRACPPACLQGHLQLLAKTSENGQPPRLDGAGLF